MRRTQRLILLLAITACTRSDLAGPPERTAPAISALIAAGGSAGSNAGFAFLPPIGRGGSPVTGATDLTLEPTVVICELAAGVCGATIATFTGSDVATFTDDGHQQHRWPRAGHRRGYYQVDWRAADPRLSESAIYRINVSVAGLQLGFADLVIERGGRKAIDRSQYAVVRYKATLPIKFRILEHSVAAIGPSGGIASAPGGGAVLAIPAGALGVTTGIAIVPSGEPAPGPGVPTVVPGTTFEFQPAGLTFDPPATLTLSYNPLLLPGGPGVQSRLAIYHFANGAWSLVAGSTVNPSTHQVSASITGFSSYSIGVIPAGVTGTLSVGDQFSCAIRGAATWCWGVNNLGSLGNGSLTPFEASPVAVTGGHAFTLITAGLRHACGLDAGGSAWCWGLNNGGQLGNGTQSNSAVPVAAAQGFTFVDISAGAFHTCGLTAASEVWCWGGVGGSGALGNGSNGSNGSLVPVRATAPAGVLFATISAGGLNTCALSTTQDGYCWGSNVDGQLGDGTTTDRQVPTPVAGGHKFQALVIASVNSILNSTCGVEPNGSAWCWGNNAAGQLGITGGPNMCTFPSVPPFPCASLPQPVSGGLTFDLVIPGNLHSCGQTRGGQVACWGYNGQGQLGDGTRVSRSLPATVNIPGGVTLVGVGGFFSCALTPTELYCWGNSTEGEVGNGTDGLEPSPVQVAGSGWQSLASNLCAADGAGSVSCWGSIPLGSPPVGGGVPSGTQTSTPTPIGGQQLHGISGLQTFGCGLDGTAGAWCWGAASTAGLGDGVTTFSMVPVPVAGGHTFSMVNASESHACGVESSTGQIWCWGLNSSGQLGDNSTTNRPTPVMVSSATTFVAVSAGSGFTCGISTAGDVYCWGLGRFGQLGYPVTPLFPGVQLTPLQVPGVGSVSAIATGQGHACALHTNGSLTCWGSNGSGELGLGAPNNVSAGLPPTSVPGLPPMASISAGQGLTCGTDTTGNVYCWGGNNSGQLGDGTFTNRASPTLITGVSGVSRLALGRSSTTCALQTAGIVFCWGYNGGGGVGAAPPYVLLPARVF